MNEVRVTVEFLGSAYKGAEPLVLDFDEFDISQTRPVSLEAGEDGKPVLVGPTTTTVLTGGTHECLERKLTEKAPPEESATGEEDFKIRGDSFLRAENLRGSHPIKELVPTPEWRASFAERVAEDMPDPLPVAPFPKDIEVKTVSEWFQILQERQDAGHDLLSADDPKARLLGFTDGDTGECFSISLGTLKKHGYSVADAALFDLPVYQLKEAMCGARTRDEFIATGKSTVGISFTSAFGPEDPGAPTMEEARAVWEDPEFDRETLEKAFPPRLP